MRLLLIVNALRLSYIEASKQFLQPFLHALLACAYIVADGFEAEARKTLNMVQQWQQERRRPSNADSRPHPERWR